jgi:putative SOS response-associated peptidase YedK
VSNFQASRQDKLLEMLRPYPAEEMEAYPVRAMVNNPRNETTECVVLPLGHPHSPVTSLILKGSL